jgi:pimeloyl-ACP methyl ester carboxylesterase
MSSRVKRTSEVPRSKRDGKQAIAKTPAEPSGSLLAGGEPAKKTELDARAPTAVARPQRREGFAVALDGAAIYYRVHQPPQPTGEIPVIFTDGIGCDGYVWKYLEPELARTRTIVHWHYRGHGKTPIPRDAERVSIADCSDDLTAILDATGIDRAVLAGHSMGVQVCLETFRRQRARVAGLILLCGSYGNPLRTFKGRRTLEDLLPFLRFGVHRIPRLVTAFWKNIIPTNLAYTLATLTEVNAELVRREDFFPYLQHIAHVDVRLFFDMLAAAGRHTAREILPEVDVPTQIIAGDRDGFTPMQLSEEMHEKIAGSRLHVVANGSHTAPIEKPGEVNEAIVEFLDALSG